MSYHLEYRVGNINSTLSEDNWVKAIVGKSRGGSN